MIANLQYGWTLFIDPIDAKHHWGRAAIQVTFTIFIVMETWIARATWSIGSARGSWSLRVVCWSRQPG
jgi:hypothetical protein